MGGKENMVEKSTNSDVDKKINSLWLLDVFRGLSALLIVLYHYTTQYDKSIGHLVDYKVTFPWDVMQFMRFFC